MGDSEGGDDDGEGGDAPAPEAFIMQAPTISNMMHPFARARGYPSDGELAATPASRPRTVAFADQEPIVEGDVPACDADSADGKMILGGEEEEERGGGEEQADGDAELMVWAGGCHSFIGRAGLP